MRACMCVRVPRIQFFVKPAHSSLGKKKVKKGQFWTVRAGSLFLRWLFVLYSCSWHCCVSYSGNTNVLVLLGFLFSLGIGLASHGSIKADLVYLLLFCCNKHQDQSNFKKKGFVLAYSARGLEFTTTGKTWHGDRAEADMITCSSTHRKQSEQAGSGGCETINPQSPPPKACFLQQGSISSRFDNLPI